jgi:DNA-binding response OmpR family regulator
MSKSLIYIIEDDKALGMILKKVLTVNGYENIEVFSDGRHCIDELHKKPALIILDFSLETMNGLDVLKIIKSKRPKSKVVIFSSLANDTELMDKCKAGGALACFNKNDSGRNELISWIDKNLNSGFLSMFK